MNHLLNVSQILFRYNIYKCTKLKISQKKKKTKKKCAESTCSMGIESALVCWFLL